MNYLCRFIRWGSGLFIGAVPDISIYNNFFFLWLLCVLREKSAFLPRRIYTLMTMPLGQTYIKGQETYIFSTQIFTYSHCFLFSLSLGPLDQFLHRMQLQSVKNGHFAQRYGGKGLAGLTSPWVGVIHLLVKAEKVILKRLCRQVQLASDWILSQQALFFSWALLKTPFTFFSSSFTFISLSAKHEE